MDFLELYEDALKEEYNFLRNYNPRIHLLEGKYLYEENGGFVYSFTLSKEVGLPDGTPVYIYNEICTCAGSVVFSESYEIVLKVQKKLNLNSKIEFTSAVQELIKILIDRLNKIDYSNCLVDILIRGNENKLDNRNFVVGQNKAIQSSLVNPITIIWGPPGTGKTHTLAEIALQFFEEGKSVLIVSQSNIAVDNAMLKIKQFVRERNIANVEGKIFRAGYSKIKEIFSRNDESDFYINARQYVEKNNPDLIIKLKELLILREEEQPETKLKELNENIANIRDHIRSMEEQLIYSSQILGTTISKATVDEKIANRNFDVVLFDEASMAYVPQIVYACSLAKEHFVCIGDFRQLPPIVQSNENSILSKDIFEFLGIYSAPTLYNHKWLVMLNEQRRMHPNISRFVRERIYAQQLIDHQSTKEIRNKIIEKGPCKNCAIAYFDIDSISSLAISKEVGKTYSHFNLVSAVISVLLALKAKDEGQESIAIIAPYKNQVNLIKSILMDLHISQDNGVYCSTIHQYQGRESDVIIFDTVDAKPMNKLGKLLDKGDNSVRLVNVAITRTKGKFILIGSNSIAQGNNILLDLWKHVTRRGKKLSFDDFRISNIKCQIADNIEEIGSTIKKDKNKIIASFNNDVLDSYIGFFDVLNAIELSNDDSVFLSKRIEDSKLAIIATHINKIAKQNIGHKSVSYDVDNLLIKNENKLILPIFSRDKANRIFFILEGRHTINNIMDLEYEQLYKEKDLKSNITPVKEVDVTKWIKCPICELNMMHPGEECCVVCAANLVKMQKPIKRTVEEIDRVTLWDICELWAKLLGEEHNKWFWANIKLDLKNAIHNNKKIARVQADCSWTKSGKVYYYDRNDVFREFFLKERRVGQAIMQCGIESYSQLLNNVLYVSSKVIL